MTPMFKIPLGLPVPVPASHLVLSTLNCASASNTVVRTLAMSRIGLSPAKPVLKIVGLAATRLVDLCPRCVDRS